MKPGIQQRLLGRSPIRRTRRIQYIAFALASIQPTPTADLLPIRIGELLALADFANGTAEHRAWRDLDDMRRVAASLGRAGIGPEALPLADEAARALARSWREHGPMAMGPADMATLRELAVVHDLQRIAASRREFVRANVEALAEAQSCALARP